MATDREIPVRVGSDLEGVTRSFDGARARLQFVVAKAFPPGQPLQLTLLPPDGQVVSLQARSLGSKRRDDQRFDVQARLVSVSRATREALERAFGSAQSS